MTKASGIANADFGTSAAWLDYDKDGRLDLFVANYVRWTRKDRSSLLPRRRHEVVLHARSRTPARRRSCFATCGGGRFGDVSKAAGVQDPTSKSLGIAVLDFDGDAWPDLFVANDTQPNKLYRNNRNGTFTETGLRAGVAYSEEGIARGAMGVDAADYDRSGRPHLLIGNFSNQMLGLYHNEGNGLFVDEAPRSTIGRVSLLTLAFGVFFFDYDLDGWPDILAANGHIEEEIGRVQPKVQYQQPPLVFRNLGARRFEHVTPALGADFSRPIVARGAAYADYDHDGDLDVALTTNHGPAYLYRNDGGNRQQLDRRPRARDEIESRRHRRHRASRERRGSPMADGAEWIELRVPERPDPHLRPRRQSRAGRRGGGVAQRRARAHRQRPHPPIDRRRGRPRAGDSPPSDIAKARWRPIAATPMLDDLGDAQHQLASNGRTAASFWLAASASASSARRSTNALSAWEAAVMRSRCARRGRQPKPHPRRRGEPRPSPASAARGPHLRALNPRASNLCASNVRALNVVLRTFVL